MKLKLAVLLLAVPVVVYAAGQPPAPTLDRPTAANTKKVASQEEPDSDGCIEAIGWCSSGPQTEQRGKTTLLRFENSCPFRVYGTFINGLDNGKVDAGASGVGSGKTHVWPTQEGNGRSFVRVVGSTKPGNDWVCASKLQGFAAGDSTLERKK